MLPWRDIATVADAGASVEDEAYVTVEDYTIDNATVEDENNETVADTDASVVDDDYATVENEATVETADDDYATVKDNDYATIQEPVDNNVEDDDSIKRDDWRSCFGCYIGQLRPTFSTSRRSS